MSNFNIEFKITTDPNYLAEESAITPELSAKLERYHQLAIDGKRSSIKKLQDAIKQYPDNPQLKNYLCVLYGQLNEYQKMYDVNKWIISEHPNYLFGKLNLANEYYLKQEYDKIPDVLGPDMVLKSLYPHRDTFHLIEVISFLKTAILYFVAIGDLKQAEIRVEIMCDVAPDSFETEFAMEQLIHARMNAAHKRYQEEQKTRISVTVKPQEFSNINKAPNFYHQEIDWLYNNGLLIEEEKINAILALPRDSLIRDLEMVLQDSIIRYGYFQKWTEENGWQEEKMNFLTHALFLLGELKATKSINACFDVLSQSEEYLQFYFEDFLTELIWEPIYKIASNNLEACKQFMFEPGIYTFARDVIPTMIAQVALHHPERQDEVLDWYNDVFQFFLNSNLEDNVIDSDLIALMISSLIEINGIELLTEIKKLYDRELVSKGICGDWNEVNHDFIHPDDYTNKMEIHSIIDTYKNITSTWASYRQEDDDYNEDYDGNYDEDFLFDYSDSDNKQVNMPILANPKIGRNEPCPCGSGKKYKRCCINI